MKKSLLLIPLAVCALVGAVSKAQETAIVACVSSMTEKVGISPDLAYQECKKKSVVECIKSLSGSTVKLAASKKVEVAFYLILGLIRRFGRKVVFGSQEAAR